MNWSPKARSRAGSPAEVAAQVDVVFTNLPDSPDVEKVVLGEKGIIEGAHQGLIFVDNSTIKPATARMIAEETRSPKARWRWMRRSPAAISAPRMARSPSWWADLPRPWKR